MTEERPEWVHCIRGENGKSLCGHDLTGEWAFVSKQHALDNIETHSRLEPCEKCMEAVLVQKST